MRVPYSKKEYKNLKKIAKKNDIKFFTVDLSDENFTYNGISVAYTPSVYGEDCVMLEVAVSYCAKSDEFKNKHGKFHALNKFYAGERVKIPLASYMREYGANAVEDSLADCFII